MLIITGTIHVESEAELERVRSALTGRARRSRNDAGNIEYTFSQNLETPTEIQLVEKWESEAALNAHLQVPDPEFDELLRTAKIVSAVVICNETSGERVLLKR